MRHDIHGKDGLTPSRSSASTLTQSTTASSSLGSLGPRPSGHGTGSGGLQMEQEQEVIISIIVFLSPGSRINTILLNNFVTKIYFIKGLFFVDN